MVSKYMDRTQLTPREAEIQALQSQGLSTIQIAEQLRLKEGTVKHHLYSIGLRKRGKSSERAEGTTNTLDI